MKRKLPEEYTGLFGDTIKVNPASAPNPCITIYGKGPDGTKCKTCAHLQVLEYSKNYYKCDLRNNTHGPATDHRINWPTCGKYEATP